MKSSYTISAILSLGFMMGIKAHAINLADEEKRWAPTEFKVIYLDNTFTTEYCGKNPLRFIGCTAGIERFASFQNEKLEITVQNKTLKLEESDHYQLMNQDFRAYQEYRRKKFQSFEKEFSPELVTALIDTYLELRKKNPQPRSHEIALSINEAISIIFDQYRKWIPLLKYDGFAIVSETPNIGADFEWSQGDLMIKKVLINSEAERAGLKPQDTIIEVNGKKPEGLKSMEHPLNSIVRLKVKRDEETFTLTTRFGYTYKSPMVDRLLKDKSKLISYVSMPRIPNDFEADVTCNIIEKYLEKVDKKTNGLILDLRGNNEGPSDVAACVIGLFAGNKHAFTKVDVTETSETKIMSKRKQIYTRNLIILVDSQTSGASEMLAASLQFHGRALVVGDRTFGNATEQIQDTYKNDFVAQLMTISYLYLPDGSTYQSEGLAPDLLVYQKGFSPSASEKKALRNDDYAIYPLRLSSRDVQMERTNDLRVATECVQEAKINERMSSLEHTDWKRDFQLQLAIEALSCF